MKLQLISNDDVLLNKLKDSPVFEEIETVFAIEELTGDCIVISNEIVPYDDLQELQFSDTQTVFYILETPQDASLERSIKILCDSKNIIFIPPRLALEQIVQKITDTFHQSKIEKSHVITFFSSVSNIGTTSTCLSVAKALSKHTKAKIGVLLLNAWDKGTYQLDYQGEYLDTIKSKIENQVIGSKEEFLSLFHMVEQDSLYILGGNRYTKLERLYDVESIHYLIQLAKQHFDLVLIDAGSHFDNALMVQALYESDMRFFVVNQQPKVIERFNSIFDEILYPLGYKRSDFLSIINQYVDKPQFPKPKMIGEELNMINITILPQIEDALFTELERKTLYEFSDEVYNTAIYAIVRSITTNASIELVQQEETRRRRWFGFNVRGATV